MPDYEVIEWNEENIDFSENQFAREAYEKRKGAFISDYVRLLVLVKMGGIYLDTDVEVVKNFNDLLEYKAVAGVKKEKFVMTAVMTAVMTSEPVASDF